MTTLPYWEQGASAGNSKEVITIPIFLKRATPAIMQLLVFGNDDMGLEPSQCAAMGLCSLADWLRFDFADEDLALVTGGEGSSFPAAERDLVARTQESVRRACRQSYEATYLDGKLQADLEKVETAAKRMADQWRDNGPGCPSQAVERRLKMTTEWLRREQGKLRAQCEEAGLAATSSQVEAGQNVFDMLQKLWWQTDLQWADAMAERAMKWCELDETELAAQRILQLDMHGPEEDAMPDASLKSRVLQSATPQSNRKPLPDPAEVPAEVSQGLSATVGPNLLPASASPGVASAATGPQVPSQVPQDPPPATASTSPLPTSTLTGVASAPVCATGSQVPSQVSQDLPATVGPTQLSASALRVALPGVASTPVLATGFQVPSQVSQDPPPATVGPAWLPTSALTGVASAPPCATGSQVPSQVSQVGPTLLPASALPESAPPGVASAAVLATGPQVPSQVSLDPLPAALLPASALHSAAPPPPGVASAPVLATGPQVPCQVSQDPPATATVGPISLPASALPESAPPGVASAAVLVTGPQVPGQVLQDPPPATVRPTPLPECTSALPVASAAVLATSPQFLCQVLQDPPATATVGPNALPAKALPESGLSGVASAPATGPQVPSQVSQDPPPATVGPALLPTTGVASCQKVPRQVLQLPRVRRFPPRCHRIGQPLMPQMCRFRPRSRCHRSRRLQRAPCLHVRCQVQMLRFSRPLLP